MSAIAYAASFAETIIIDAIIWSSGHGLPTGQADRASSRRSRRGALAVTVAPGHSRSTAVERGHDLGGARRVQRPCGCCRRSGPGRSRRRRRCRPWATGASAAAAVPVDARSERSAADRGARRPSPRRRTRRSGGGGAWRVQARPNGPAGVGSAGENGSGPAPGGVPPWGRGHLPSRISARIAAIQESATLAVDAKAKALKAAGENVIGFGAGEPDFPTPGARRRGGRSPRAATPASTTTRRRRACPSCARRSRSRPSATRASTARPRRSSSRTAASTPSTTRSRRCATRATRCSLPAPYWTSYPEVITLARRRAGRAPDDRRPTGFRVTVEQLEAALHAAHEGVAVRLAEQPDRRGVPARGGRGDRPLGARARHLGRDRRDLRAPHLRRSRVLVDARPRARDHGSVRDPERRREDLRDDGLARRLDDRARRRDRGGDEPAVALHVERLERRAGGRARGGERRPLGRGRDARARSRAAAT